jgi:hypothetical protein
MTELPKFLNCLSRSPRAINPSLAAITAFAAVVAQAEQEARRAQGYPVDAVLDHRAQAAVHRVALQKVLLALGLLRLV